jgi:hypothetical protein
VTDDQNATSTALTRNLALEIAPIRVNLIAAASWTHRYRRRSSATSWTRVASSFARRSRSAGGQQLVET